MLTRRTKLSAFTLIELILVLVIMAIAAALVMPALSAFARGRNGANTATLIVSLANYARTQAATQGQTYRLYFDQAGGQIQLRVQNGATFVPAPNEYGESFHLPEGLQMQVTVAGQVNTLLVTPTDEQQVMTQDFGSISQPGLAANSLMQNQHQVDTYVEFSPTGRTDQAKIQLSDSKSSPIVISCDSATDLFHIQTPDEMNR